MPPGQPILWCQGDGCGLIRPCKQADDGRWYCVDCHPALNPSASDERPHAAPTATDGGTDR